MAKTYRKRIPKQFRIPRPMASQPAPSRFGWLRLDLLALAAGTLIAAVAPLGRLDDTLRGLALGALTDAAPSTRALLVIAAPEDLRADVCQRSLRPLLEQGHARGALLLPPVDAFCEEPDTDAAEAPAWSDDADEARPVSVVRLPIGALRQVNGEIVGFSPLESVDHAAELAELGVTAAPWIVAKAPQSIPAVTLHDLAEDRVPASALEDRVAVVAVGVAGVGGVGLRQLDASTLPPPDRVAAVLGGLLDGGRRAPCPRWAPPAFVLLAGALVWAARRRYGSLAATLSLFLATAAVVFGQLALAAHVEASLAPIPSTLLGLAVAFAGVMLARGLSRQRAVDQAAELIDRAALFRMQSVHTLADQEFWPRVARLAEQAHPADLVLIAELPARGWHLAFWNDRRGGESLIQERRRDIRRIPYSSEQGVPTIRVTRSFLTRPDMPTVVVPLMALGEIEGYVFFCGAAAEESFSREPARTERVSRELALLLRRKRLARLEADGKGRAASPGANKTSDLTDHLVEGARVALEDLQLFGSVLRHAPVGLLYADAFGDVRFLASEFAKWLRAHDIAVPAESANAALPPGALTLGDILRAASASQGEALSLSSVMGNDEGIELQVTTPEPALLSVRPFRRQSDGASWIAGYVAALVPAQQATPTSLNVRALASWDATDPLCAFTLGDIVTDAVSNTARATGRTLRLEPIRGSSHAIGHRSELAEALERFLVDVSGRGLPGHGPVVSVREMPHGVQLSILDVGFGLGLPESALQRVLMAPGAVPAGLEPLGRLILAVEDSHGQAELKTNDGWGITLTITLLRAHPRIGPAAHEGGKPATPNVISIGRAGPK